MELVVHRPKARKGYLATGHRSPAKEWVPARTARSEQFEALTTERAPRLSRNSNTQALDHIEKAIDRSRYVGELGDNWDEAGAQAIAPRTWQRAVTFLRESAAALLKDCGIVIEAPRILPGPEGTVDLHWQNGRFLLLINITSVGAADFYGETPTGLSLRGEFIPELHQQGILSWLKDHSS